MKIGRKNEIKLDPLAYNFMLIGESGIGKSSVCKEYCEKLAGEDGYIFLEMGKEDGNDAINGLNYVTCDSWDEEYDEESNTIGFATFIDDVVENKASDWPNLKVVVVDTLDELFMSIAEPEVIRMHNRENPAKRVKSIKAAFGGFLGGEDKAIEIVQDKLWALKKVGVSFIIIGHTKTRNNTDPITGEDYMQLTTNMPQRYFNAIKNKVHFLGVASIDRTIVREKGKKNIVTGEVATRGIVKSETRKITFRDDNYVVDSKSRFADIVPEIPLNSDELIKALTDAIKAEQAKSGTSLDDAKRKQEEEKKRNMERVAKREEESRAKRELEEVLSEIVDFISENKSDMSKVKPILEACKERGYANPKEIDNVDDAKAILAITLK